MTNPYKFTPSTEYRLRLDDMDFRLLFNKLDSIDHETVRDNPGLLHSHEYSELFVCTFGTISLMTETGSITINSGEAAIVPPGISHRKQKSDHPEEWYSVCFSGTHKNVRGSEGLYRKLRLFLEGNSILVFRKIPNLANEIKRIEKEFHANNTFQPPLLLASLLLNMTNSDKPIRIPIPAGKTLVSGEINRSVKMEEIIDERFTEDWNASRISDAMHLSSRQVDRIAQKKYGKSFRQALMDKRCQIAAHLLTTTDMTVIKIMIASGFNSVKSLYREFKQRYETAPIEYRKRFIEGNADTESMK